MINLNIFKSGKKIFNYKINCIYEIFHFFKKCHFWQILIILTIIILIGEKYNEASLKNKLELSKNYFKLQLDINFTFKNKLNNKINIAILCNSIKNGGIERLVTLLIKNLEKIKIFNSYLLTKQSKEKNEYKIPFNMKRIIINSKNKNHLIKILKLNKIDILIYNFYEKTEIESLNNFKNTKTIFYNHSCFLIWIYAKLYNFYKTIYNSYKNSKYVISLIPLENDYLLKKWGIKTILMSNFISYEYNKVIPSDLSSLTILMIGRGDDHLKRFELGIEAMKYLEREIPEFEMKIISNLNCIDNLSKMVNFLNLEKNIKFVGYTPNPELYFKNASLHIFPSVCESFGLVLSETKIFGIPNILIGLDYISIAKGGTIIIYEDNSESIANEAKKILKDKKYRKKLGKEARKSMKKYQNEFLLKKWIKLILSINNGGNYYEKLRKEENIVSENKLINILKNQIILLKNRMPNILNISFNNVINFTFMKNIYNCSIKIDFRINIYIILMVLLNIK